MLNIGNNIKVREGNILDSKMQTLINTVNCVGVMGKGIALEFKKRFPEMYKDYVLRCNDGQVKLGYPYLFKTTDGPWILNFPTKDHWRSSSNIDDIERGLRFLIGNYGSWGIRSLAVPPLGCGQGQLEWKVVGPTLFRYLSKLTIPIELYAPHGTPQKELQLDFLLERSQIHAERKPATELKIDPAWIALVDILHRIESEPYHWPVGRTRFQKIAYLATIENLPTGLTYQRGSYGPFSSEVKGVVTKLINNGLITEKKLGRMLAIEVGRTFQDAREAYGAYLRRWEDQISKIADLCLRMSTSQAEIVSSVLFVYKELEKKHNQQVSELDVWQSVLDWKHRRKPALDAQELALTIRNLLVLNWINVKPSKELPLPD